MGIQYIYEPYCSDDVIIHYRHPTLGEQTINNSDFEQYLEDNYPRDLIADVELGEYDIMADTDDPNIQFLQALWFYRDESFLWWSWNTLLL